jgi:HTH-type transcriptional regulator/antitoxin MqsA
MNANMKCNDCDTGVLSASTWTAKVKHNDKVLSVENLECYLCNTCGADPVFAGQIRRNQLKIVDAKRASDSLWTSSEIIAFREKYGITQNQAALIFGGGANAFSKYERGEVIQSVAMDNQLKMADKVDGALAFLASKADVQLPANKPSKSVYTTISILEYQIKSRNIALLNFGGKVKPHKAYSADYSMDKCA